MIVVSKIQTSFYLCLHCTFGNLESPQLSSWNHHQAPSVGFLWRLELSTWQRKVVIKDSGVAAQAQIPAANCEVFGESLNCSTPQFFVKNVPNNDENMYLLGYL